MLTTLMQLDQKLTLFFNGSSSLFLDFTAATATATATWLGAAVVLLYVIIRNNTLRGVLTTVLGIALCITLADQLASGICKPLFERFRPTQDPFLMYTVDVVEEIRGGRYGFFSSHAANTMSVAMFVSLIVKDRNLAVWLFSWALLNCWTRVYLGVHYVGDLTVGTIWGCTVGWMVYKLWKRLTPQMLRRRDLATVHTQCLTAGGFSVRSVRLFEASIVLSYLYVMFKAVVLSC